MIYFNRGLIKFLFSAFFIAGLCPNNIAQSDKILLDHYTSNEGLSSNIVWDICKNRKGYLWIGTQDGLNRFDGKNFRVYRYSAADTQSISNNTIYDILEDRDGYIWLNTFDGICRYNPANDKFTRIKLSDAPASAGRIGFGALGFDTVSNILWAAGRGLYSFEPRSLQFKKAGGGVIDKLLRTAAVNSMLIEPGKRIWLGSDIGLIVYYPSTGHWSVYYTPVKKFLSSSNDYMAMDMFFDRKGKLWMGTWGAGLFEFDTAQKKFSGPYLSEKSDGFKGGTNIIFSLAQTGFDSQENLLWVAANNGFQAFNTVTKQFTSYRTEISDSRNGVFGKAYCVFTDADGLWIGSEKGIYRYDKRLHLFSTLPYNYNFKNACLNYAFDIYTDPADITGNTLYIATWSCGIFRYDLSTGKLEDLPGWMASSVQPDYSYTNIIRDQNGVLWVASDGNGLISFDEEQKKAIRFFLRKSNNEVVSAIYFLFEDKDGRLWVGSADGLFVKNVNSNDFIEIKWNVPDSQDIKLSRTVSGICADQHGNIWFTARSGYKEALPVCGRVQKGNDVAEIFYPMPGNLPSLPDVKVINNIICDKYNNLWCATWNGLITWNAAGTAPAFRLYTTDDGLLNNFVYQVKTDQDGNIWCGTQGGLSVRTAAGRFRSFYNTGIGKENIEDLFMHSSQPVMFVADWGKLHTLNLKAALINSQAPVITISDFRVFNKPAAEVKKFVFDGSLVSLAYNRNVVTIDFTALSYFNPRQVRYAYKMEGVDNEWIVTANNSVTYNLMNGHYTFRVKAMNSEGVWNEEGTFMEIIVRAPFWKKGWFIALLALLAVAGSYLIFRYRLAQLKKLQDMRNNISRDLHDDIGASLSNINILNELAKRNVSDPVKAKEYLDKSGEDIQRISESLSDIVWNINPRYDDLQNLFVRMKRYAADMMDGKNIRYSLEFPDDVTEVSLSMEKRRDFYLIFKEAVNNLVKYSRAAQALLKVEIIRKKIILTVQDNGCGFDMQLQRHGNGIANMQQRAQVSGGHLVITSGLGRGTEVKLELHST
jgi:ligand-binding sensor domain-containing protein/two-component sensor histidine kinase